MKKFIIIFGSLMIIPILWHCKNSIENSDNRLFQIDFDEFNTSIKLKLSDLLDSCRLVPLETTNESILGNYFYFTYIADDIILIADRTGVFKFASDGRFIKKILSNGRGPGEISATSCRYYYHENQNILYIENDFIQADHIMRYDTKSEKLLTPIKKCFQTRWNSFIVLEDTLIMASIEGIARSEDNPYAIFIQNFKGQFVKGSLSNKTYILPRGEGEEILQRMLISEGQNSIYLRYLRDDTLFTFENNKISPILISNKKYVKGIPKMIPEIGEKNIGYKNLEAGNFLIFYLIEFCGWIDRNGLNRANHKRDFYILNKTNGQYALIESYTDDLVNQEIKLGKSIPWTPGIDKDVPFPKSLPNGKAFTYYYPSDITQKNLDQAETNFPKYLLLQFSQIKKGIKETDNPVLLIGTSKRDLHILK